MVGRSVDKQQRKPANLVFVIDISGSMSRESRLGAVKRALRTLVDELGEGDRVGLVVYGSQGEVRLPLTDISRRETILAAIDGPAARRQHQRRRGPDTWPTRWRATDTSRGIINRLILCSDGVANTGGATDADGILRLVRRASDEGITLSTVGFGMGNYNDVLMEKLADQGDGNYFYVDRPDEAERVFRENLTGMLQTIARQTKVQVEFDPRRVARWRLLGYENRDVADRDFRNDAVDAGEVGAGHQVTALYEVKLVEDGRGRGQHRVDEASAARRHRPPALGGPGPRYGPRRQGHRDRAADPRETCSRCRSRRPRRSGGPRRWRPSSPRSCAAATGPRTAVWSTLVPVADDVARQLSGDAAVQDLARMIRRAAEIADGRDPQEYPQEKD